MSDDWEPFGDDSPFNPNLSQDFSNDFDFDDEVFSDTSSTSSLGAPPLYPSAPAFNLPSSTLSSVPSFNSFHPLAASPQYQSSFIPRQRFPFSSNVNTNIFNNSMPNNSSSSTNSAAPIYSALDRFKPRTNRTFHMWTSTNLNAARNDQYFNDTCQNPLAIINPVNLGFIPLYYWPKKAFTFGDLVFDFFQRKNNINSRFMHKLYNALRLSTLSQTYRELTGVTWLNSFIIRVNKGQFARLLGITTIDGSLFHQQGNFSKNDFIELGRVQALQYCTMEEIQDVDFDDIRLLIHKPGKFVMTATPEQIQSYILALSKKRLL